MLGSSDVEDSITWSAGAGRPVPLVFTRAILQEGDVVSL